MQVIIINYENIRKRKLVTQHGGVVMLGWGAGRGSAGRGEIGGRGSGGRGEHWRRVWYHGRKRRERNVDGRRI